jgi:hypothetical protein
MSPRRLTRVVRLAALTGAQVVGAFEVVIGNGPKAAALPLTSVTRTRTLCAPSASAAVSSVTVPDTAGLQGTTAM